MRLLKLILFSIGLFLGTKVPSQDVQKQLLSAIKKDSVKNIYGNNKEFIPEYELQSLVALSFYPELINTKITFRLADKESVAKTTITFFSILHNRDKHFIIYINDNKRRTGIVLQEASFNAQIGAIGHELAHVADFDTKNISEMIGWGIKYFFKKSKVDIERKTDIATIQHGLGMELYYFVDFVLNHSNANNEYKKFKRLNYLSPAELLQRIEKLK